MNNTYLDNNQAKVVGEVVSELIFSHEVYGESFFSFKINVPRLSDAVDVLIITISERLLSLTPVNVGDHVSITGQFRSYNNFSDVGSRLILTIFAKDIEKIESCHSVSNPNSIYLNGYVCKNPIYRTTPFGREIADILLAVNRSYNKSDYIPCIAWGRNAKFTSTIVVGENIKIWGRIQSREYQKKISEEEFETKVAYEISVSKMELSNKENQYSSPSTLSDGEKHAEAE